MPFSHEKLDVYKASMEFACFVAVLVREIPSADRFARDQLVRASLSIPLNIAEGNGKRSPGDRRRFFEIARGSSLECAAALDLLVAFGACGQNQVEPGKQLLFRIVSMLTKMTEPTDNRVREPQPGFSEESKADNDYGSDHDHDHDHDHET